MYVKCLARVLTRAACPVEGSMLLCLNLPASLQEVHAEHRQCGSVLDSGRCQHS